MTSQPGRTLDAVGAASGLATVLLLLALFMVFPALPAPNKPIGEIATSAADNRDGLLAGAYVGALMTGALLLFGAAVAVRLYRSDASAGWWVVALTGIGGTAVGIVSDALVVTFVRAVGHGASGNALWVGYGPDHWVGSLVGVPIAIFLLGAGLGGRETGALPRWLASSAVGLAPAFLVGSASVMGDEVDGGIPGTVLVLAYLGLLVWIVGCSITMLRRGAIAVQTSAAAPALG